MVKSSYIMMTNYDDACFIRLDAAQVLYEEIMIMIVILRRGKSRVRRERSNFMYTAGLVALNAA